MSGRRLNVLHVFRTWLPDTRGGAQEVIRQIALATASLGVTNRVFTPSPDPHPAMLNVEGIDVVRVPLNAEVASCGFCFTGLREFRRQVDWADIVHYHFPWPFQDLMHLLAGVDKPSLVTYHADIVRQQRLLMFYSPLRKWFLDKVDHIVCTSESYAESSDQLAIRRDKTSVIPIGLDEASYPRVDDAEIERVRNDVGERFFFFVGMLRYYKGLETLLAASAGRNFKVVIAGKGPMEADLKHQALALGLDNVRFLGEVDDATKVALYQLCRAVVFSSQSRAEAFGVTLLEGAMYGRPLVTAEVGSGTTWVNRHGETGLAFPAGDNSALANALQELHDDDSLAERLGTGAYQRFTKLFRADVMGKAYVERYRTLLGV